MEPGCARWGPAMGPAAAAQELPAEHELELLPCAVPERWHTLPRGSGASLGGNSRAVRTRSCVCSGITLHRPMSRCVPSELPALFCADYRCRGLQQRHETRAVKHSRPKNEKNTSPSGPQRAGFEPARGDPIGFQVQRLNHSAIAADGAVAPRLHPYRAFLPSRPRPQPVQPMSAAGPGPAPPRSNGGRSGAGTPRDCQGRHLQPGAPGPCRSWNEPCAPGSDRQQPAAFSGRHIFTGFTIYFSYYRISKGLYNVTFRYNLILYRYIFFALAAVNCVSSSTMETECHLTFYTCVLMVKKNNCT